MSGVDERIVTADMHERKRLMAMERADAFVALPGGIGTTPGSNGTRRADDPLDRRSSIAGTPSRS